MSVVQIGDATLIHGDCLEWMAKIPEQSVDMIATDLPYGTTQNSWDSVIPLPEIWGGYERIASENCAVVLNCAQPFTSILIMSNIKKFKYSWIWRKTAATGHLNAKKQPMRDHEDIAVFLYGKPPYNPQGLKPLNKIVRRGNNGGCYGASGSENFQEWTNYPRSVLDIPSENKTVHPTQKPVELMSYMIKTYTNDGGVVFDSTMGSGTTGVAAINTGRKFIGIEKEEKYFQIACERIQKAWANRDQSIEAAA